MGGAPPPRLAMREHIPLSPTMQPQLHIFSHFDFRPPQDPARRPSARIPGAWRRSVYARACKNACTTRRWERPCSREHTAGGTGASGSRPPRQPLRSPPMRAHLMIASGRRPGFLLVAVILLAIAAAIAGCGSSKSSGTSVDPATAVPATASLYAGAVVRPDEPLKASAKAAGQTLTHQADPYLRLLGALQTPGSPTLDYKRDIAPWLGVNAGAFMSGASGSGATGVDRLLTLLEQALLSGSNSASAFPFAASGVQGAIVLNTSDSAKAGSFLDSQANHAGAHAATYRGVPYHATSGGVAFGIVQRLAVIGSVAGLQSVIDTTLGGPALAHATAYSKLLASAPSGVLAHVYSNAAGFSAGAASKGTAGIMTALAGDRPINVSLVPSAGSIAVDADALSSGSSSRSSGLLVLRRRSRSRARGTSRRIVARRWPRRRRHDARRRRRGPAEPGLARKLAVRSGRLRTGFGDAQRQGPRGRLPRTAASPRRRQRRSAPRLRQLDGIGGYLRERQRTARTEGRGGDRLEQSSALPCRRRKARVKAPGGRWLGADGFDPGYRSCGVPRG